MKLRKFLNVLLFSMMAICLCFALVGCDGKAKEEGAYKIYLLDCPTTGDWGVWYWLNAKDGSQNAVSSSNGEWPVGATSLDKSDDISKYVTLDIENIDNYETFGCLFVNRENGNQQTTDVLVPIPELKEYKTLYFTFSNPKVYYLSYNDACGIMSGKISSADGNTISVNLSRVTSIDSNAVTVTDSKGTNLPVQSATVDSSTVGTITVTGGNIKNTPYTIEYDKKKIKVGIDGELIDEAFVYEGDDLGLTIDGSEATFKCWAPLAQKVELLILDSASSKEPSKTIEMEAGDFGVWTATTTDIATDGSKYYQYKIDNAGTVYSVADIWSYSASPDSKSSQIVDINDSSLTSTWEATYTNPFGDSGSETKTYSDAVIYEMHIRDWAKAFGASNTGKFEEITAELGDAGKFATHLKDLGITHVQILPAFDYAQPNTDTEYNWGYNPYHYNVPEGRYVKNMVDGTDAVSQFRELIKAFHDQGIAVIMDVVYNHTAGTGTNSLYDMTVPEYFYRVTSDGSYSNGSGCGNEVATNHKMVAKYVIDSLVHWMEDYHINGFRFDLMGCHEQEFMKDVYETLYDIDPNVMVYGEPWQGGTAQTKNATDKTISTTKGFGVGAFEDTFRNGIKGGEFGGFQAGHVQGTYKDTDIINGLLGKSGRNEQKNGSTSIPNGNKPGLMLSYVECHDNYTLYDKLAISQFSFSGKNDAQLKTLWKAFDELNETQKESVKAQNKLAAAYVFLSQGTPFINGGQEFMRDKKGDHNSYESDDTINGINLSYKETHIDVYNTYKGLIAFRKANSTVFGGNTSAVAEKVKDGVTEYKAGDYCVYFNATSADYDISSVTGYSNAIDVTSGTPTSVDIPSKVPAKSFVILAK